MHTIAQTKGTLNGDDDDDDEAFAAAAGRWIVSQV